jgi:lysophospholipase L1-like esterase
MLQSKKISILGDSISTYRGVSNDKYANATLYYNYYFPGYADEFPLERTYWMRVIDALGLELCVNNSWSGANLSGEDDSAGVNRARNLARDDGMKPDIVILFMGMNDLGREVKSCVFEEYYRKTLQIIKEQYDSPFVCCVNMPDRHVSVREETVVFNEIIERAVKEMGKKFFVANLFNSDFNNDNYFKNTLDGLHPDEDGMKIIAEVVEKAIRDNCK